MKKEEGNFGKERGRKFWEKRERKLWDKKWSESLKNGRKPDYFSPIEGNSEKRKEKTLNFYNLRRQLDKK